MGWDEMKEKFKKAGDEMLIALYITIAHFVVSMISSIPFITFPISLILPPAIMFVTTLGILIYVDSDSDKSD